MDYNAWYKVADARENPSPSQGVITRVRHMPGGIMFWDSLDKDNFLEWDDEDPDAFIDDEAAGVLAVTTATGMVVFEKVSV